MKNLLIISPGFPENEKDTKCIPALYLYVKKLSKSNKFKITVITPFYPYKKNTYQWFGVKVIALGLKQKTLSRLNSPLKILFELNKIKKKEKIDLIHSFWLNRNIFVADWFCKINNIPLFVTLMGQDVYKIKKLNIVNKFLKIKAKYITLSQFHNEVFKKEGNNKLDSEVIHWGTEKGLEKYISSKKEYDIIGAFSINKIKNVFEFIEIIYELKKDKNNLKVIIAGGGELEAEIKQRVFDLDLIDNIKITGLINRVKVLKLMGKSKILLHTSKFESFGMVFIEALALGCKVISYPVGIAKSDCNIINGYSKVELLQLLKKNLNYDKEIVNDYKIESTIKKYLNLYKL